MVVYCITGSDVKNLFQFFDRPKSIFFWRVIFDFDHQMGKCIDKIDCRTLNSIAVSQKRQSACTLINS